MALDGATVMASPATQVHDLAHGLNALTIRMLDRREINRMLARRSGPLPDWSWKRKASVIVFALIMTYLHSFYILGFNVSEMEYWGTVWIGVTAEQRLLSFAIALFANLGLMEMPFLRAPGRVLRAVVALSLTFGLLISIAWLSHDVWTLGLPSSYNTMIFRILDILVRIFYAIAIYLNLLFLIKVAELFRPHKSEAP